MWKIFVMLAVVFSAAFGTVLVAAEDKEPKDFTTAMEIAVKLKFCRMLGCIEAGHSNKTYCVYANGDWKKWYFLTSETQAPIS